MRTEKKKTEKKTGMKTYILELIGHNLRRITVPDSWKLTFGPTVPYVKGSTMANPTALRFYEGTKDNLRAVFTDVIAFRDADMEIMERRTEVKRQVVQRQSAGGMKNVEVEARVTEWVNPDDATDENGSDKAAPYLAQLTDMSVISMGD